MFFNRIKEAWLSFKHETNGFTGNTLLVTHSGVIDVILCIENRSVYTNKRVHYRIDYAGIVRVI